MAVVSAKNVFQVKMVNAVFTGCTLCVLATKRKVFFKYENTMILIYSNNNGKKSHARAPQADNPKDARARDVTLF